MRVAVLGTDGEDRDALVAALEEAGATVTATASVGEEALVDAEVPDCDAVVVLGGDRATLVPVARRLADGARTVMVADDAPDFVRGTVDLILTTEVGTPEAVAEALLDGGSEGGGNGADGDGGDEGADGG